MNPDVHRPVKCDAALLQPKPTPILKRLLVKQVFFRVLSDLVLMGSLFAVIPSAISQLSSLLKEPSQCCVDCTDAELGSLSYLLV